MARQRPRDPVQFTRESAERIANVVRAAETAPPPASPLRFDALLQDRVPRQVRAATFSGSWPIGSSKVVTFANAPAGTANVTNLSWPITDTGYVNENCLVGKDGPSWWLVVPVLERRTAVFVTQTQSVRVLTGVSIGGSLNTSSCAITINQTENTTNVTVVSATTTSSYLRLRVP